MMRRWVTVMVAACLASTAQASVEEVRTTARALLEKHAGALVTVKLVVKRRMVVQGQERGTSESQVEILGTVISSTGLTVVADSDSNPSGLFTSDGDGPRIDTDTSDVQLLLPDGREVPARFVLRDRDLDLAFVQPESTDLKLPYIEFGEGRVPQILDDVIFLYRASKTLNREVSVSTALVQTIVRKPRTFVVTESAKALPALGGPAFDAKGGLMGLVVLRRAPNAMADARLRGPIRGGMEVLTPVVLTVADVKTVIADAARAASRTAAAQP